MFSPLSRSFPQYIHRQKLLALMEKPQFSVNRSFGFPQTYTQPVENKLSTSSIHQNCFQHIFRILTGSFCFLSPLFPQSTDIGIHNKIQCEQPDFSKQVFIQQNTVFLFNLRRKSAVFQFKMHFPHIHSTLLRLLLRYSLNLILSFLFASANRTQTERHSVKNLSCPI